VTPPLRLGLVGCGRLAELGYLPAIGRTSAFRLVAVADPDTARASRLAVLAGDAGRGRPSTHDSAAELVDEAEIDALVVASPAGAHVDDAAAAVARGVAVLVEKPPALDAAGARKLDPRVAVGFNRRFDDGVRTVRSALPTTGSLAIDLTIHYRRKSWGAHRVEDEVLLDLGPHLVDLARWLTGSEVTAVDRAEASFDQADLLLGLDRGQAHLRMAADRLHREVIEVRAVGGGVLARHEVGGPLAAVTGRLGGGPHPLVTSLAAQLDAFARTIRGEPSTDLGTAADGVAVMDVLDTARARHQPATA
jgi:predicted dehydrogenase